MRHLIFAAALTFASFASAATAEIGKPAPGFSLQGVDGKTYTLEQFKGKTVVLEWFNNDCPYVKKHYDSGNMQKLQAEATSKGTIWLTINSSAAGKQGHFDAAGGTQLSKDRKMANTAVLLDPKGTTGKSYAAKVTPHMYVINDQGTLVYAGAIDSNSSSDPKTIAGATNYVTEALNAIAQKKAIATASTKPYGCGVKYE